MATKKKTQETKPKYDPNTKLGKYIEASGDNLTHTPTKGYWENQRQRADLATRLLYPNGKPTINAAKPTLMSGSVTGDKTGLSYGFDQARKRMYAKELLGTKGANTTLAGAKNTVSTGRTIGTKAILEQTGTIDKILTPGTGKVAVNPKTAGKTGTKTGIVNPGKSGNFVDQILTGNVDMKQVNTSAKGIVKPEPIIKTTGIKKLDETKSFFDKSISKESIQDKLNQYTPEKQNSQAGLKGMINQTAEMINTVENVAGGIISPNNMYNNKSWKLYSWMNTDLDWKKGREYGSHYYDGIELGAYNSGDDANLWSMEYRLDKAEEINDKIVAEMGLTEEDKAKRNVRYKELETEYENILGVVMGGYISSRTFKSEYGTLADHEANKEQDDKDLYNSIYGNGAYEDLMAYGTEEEIAEAEELLDAVWGIMDDASGTNRERLLEKYYNGTNKGQELVTLREQTEDNYLKNLQDQRTAIQEAEKKASKKYSLEYDLYNGVDEPDTAYHEDRGAQFKPITTPHTVSTGYGNTYSYVTVTNTLEGDDADKIYYMINHPDNLKDTVEGGLAPGWDMPFAEARFASDKIVETFNGYYNSGDKERAMEYYNSVVDSLKYISAQAKNDEALEAAENPVARFGTVFTKPINSYYTILSMAGNMAGSDALDFLADGTRYEDTLRAVGAEKWGDQFAEWFGGDAEEWGKFLNQTAYSVADNIYAQLIARGFGGGAEDAKKVMGWIMQAVMSSEATASTFVQCKDRGMDPYASVLLAVGSGIVEAATEKWSIDRYMNFGDMYGSPREMATALLNSMLPEMSEEMASEVLNTLLDEVVSAIWDEKSELSAAYQNYIDQGYGRHEAADMVAQDWFHQVGMAGLGGALGALPQGAFAMMAGRMQNKAIGKNIKNSGIQYNGKNTNENFVIKTGLEMSKESKAYQQAEKLNQKQESGKKISKGDLGILARSIVTESGENVRNTTKEAVRDVVSEELEAGGMDGATAKELGDIVSRAAINGINTLNKADRRALIENDAAHNAYIQLTTPEQMGKHAKGVNAAKEIAQKAKVKAAQETIQDRVRGAMTESIASGEYQAPVNMGGTVSTKNIRSNIKIATDQDYQTASGEHSNNPAAVVVQGDRKGVIEGFDNGKVVVQTENGTETVDPADIAVRNTEAGTIVEYMREVKGAMSDEMAGKAIATIAAKGDELGGNFADEVIKINLEARTGRKLGNYGSMDAETAHMLYDTAKNDALKADQARIKGDAKLTPGEGKASWDGAEYGTTEWKEKMKTLNKEQRNQAETVAQIARLTGLKVNFVNDTKNEKMYGHYDGNGNITINLAGKDADGTSHHLLTVAAHEATHWLQENSKEGYDALRTFAFESLEKGNVNIQKLIQDKMDLYNQYYKDNNIDQTMTMDDAIYEIVADACDQILRSDEIKNRLQKTNPNLFQKIKAHVAELIGRIRNAVKNIGKSSSFEGRALLQDVDELAKRWLGGYDEVIHGVVTQAEGQAEAQNRQAASINPYEGPNGEKISGKGRVFSIFDTNGNEVVLTEQEIEDNKITISKMQPVATIKGNRFQKNADKDFKTMAYEYFKEIGGKAESKVFGNVELNEGGIDHLTNWLTSRRAALLEAIKPVIEKGEIIYLDEKGAKHNFDSAMVAAPIEFNGDPYYMAVVIKQDENKKNSYYMHDAILARRNIGQLPVNKSLSKQTLGSNPTIAMILSTLPGYNGIIGQNTKSFSIQQNDEAYMQAVENGDMETAQRMVDEAASKDIRYSLADRKTRDYLSSWAQTHAEALEDEYEAILHRYGIDASQTGLAENGKKISKADQKKLNNLSREIDRWENYRVTAMGLDETDLGAQYVKAWQDGDTERMEEILMEKMQGTDGIIPYKAPNWYDSKHKREVANQIKNGDEFAIMEAAVEMANLVPKNAVLVPMPPHTGKVTANTDTMLLANKISELTGRPVINVLEGAERMSRKEAKEAGVDLNAEAMGFRKIAEIPEGTVPYFIDNVVGSGVTAQAAHNALGKGITLAYAKSTRAGMEGLKNVGPTYLDHNQMFLIPLEAKMDMNRNDVQGAMKYSLQNAIDNPENKFSLQAPVEATTGGLIAVHNLTYENLMDTMKEGGFTAPSVAVVKAAMGHSKYGDISVVFKTDAIDPRKDAKNKIYGADAYTPTRYNADVETELIYDEMLKMRDELTGILKGNNEINGKLRTEIERWVSEKTYKEVTNETPEELAGEAYNNEAMMAAYLVDQGKEIPVKTREYYKGNFTQKQAEEYDKAIIALAKAKVFWNGEFAEDVQNMSGKKLIEKYGAIIATEVDRANTLLELYKEKNSDLAGKSLMRIIKGAYDFANGGSEKATEIDWYETKKAMWDMIDRNDMVNWMAGKLRPAYGQIGIRNNLDPFTAYGNRRSFKTLHMPYTIENVVKAMYTNATEKGQGGRYATGAVATASKEYKTLAEVKEDSDRLEIKDQEEYDAIIDNLNSRMNDMAEEFGINPSYFDYAVIDAGRYYARNQTLDAIKRGFANNDFRITTEQAKQVKELLDDMREIPTGYFEAKPMRVVGMDEIADVIIPEKYDRLIAELDRQGIPYDTYDGTDEDRVKVLNSVPNAQFSIQNPGDMDVNQWMMSVPESSLQTEAEKQLLMNYKSKVKALEIDDVKIKGLERQIRFWEDKKNLDKKEKQQYQGAKIRLENAKTTKAIHENELAQIRSEEGYARIMKDQQQRMHDLTEGKTQDEIQKSVERMEATAERVKAEIEQEAQELAKMAADKAVQSVQSRIGKTSLDRMSSWLRKEYGSRMNKKEIETDLAKIALKIAEGQDAMQDIEDLAGRILDGIPGEGGEYLPMLRGITIRLGKGQIRELMGQNSSIREVRKMLAGTGIKVVDLEKANQRAAITDVAGNVVKGNLASLDAIWDELCDQIPVLDRDTSEKDQLSTLVDFAISQRDAKQQSGGQQYAEYLPQIIAGVYGAALGVDVGMPKDPAAAKQIRKMQDMIVEMGGRLEAAAQRMAQMGESVDELIGRGKKALAWTDAMKRDVNTTIVYFDRMSRLAVETAKKNKQDQIIQQLKDKHVQEMLKKNEEWRNLIQRDKDARRQAEDNRATMRKMATLINRVNKLLSAETDQQNIPEQYKGLARELLRIFVEQDLGARDGRHLTKATFKQLSNTKRLLDAWEKQDGPFDISFFTQNANEEEQSLAWIIQDDLGELYDAMEEWNGQYRGKNQLDTIQQMGATLKRISDATQELYRIIQSARTLDINGRKWQIEEMALRFMDELKNSRFKGELTSKAGKAADAIRKMAISGNLTPEYFFKNLRNAGMTTLWNEFKRSENRNGLEIAKAKDRLAEIAEKYHYNTWDPKAKTTIQTKNGTVEMTTEQLMALWATWKREKTIGPEMSQHIERGGFVLDEDTKGKGVLGRQKLDTKPHRMDEALMKQVEDALTDEQKAYVDEMVSYLSNEMSELGNEASMRMYGIKKYKESYYFPFKRWSGVGNFSSDRGSTAQTTENRAAHKGWTKRRLNAASNAIEIGDFTKLAVAHIVEMINYNTMAPSIENMNKMLNWQNTEYGEDNVGVKRNMRALFSATYGKEALKYLETLLTDLNGGVAQDPRGSGFDKLLSMFKKNAVAGSMSVTLQQPLSYIRAAMLINPKYLAMAMNPKTYKGSYKEMMEHSGVAVIKDMGRFDMGYGASAKEYITPEAMQTTREKVTGTISDWATKAPEIADRITWTRMWQAVKYEQHAQHPEMDMKSDEFLDLCGERFNEVMRRTQVYDSVLVKSSNMRSKNWIMKSFTSFMAEPTLSLNVLVDAAQNFKEKGGKAYAAKAGATFLLSAVLQAVMKGFMGAGRNPDDKKTREENFLYRFLYNLVSEANPLNLIPGYSDLIDVLMDGEISNDAMTPIGKLVGIVQTIQKAAEGKSDANVYRLLEDTAGQVAQLFTGVPAKNIMRDVRAMINFFLPDTGVNALVGGKPYANRPTDPNVLKYQSIDTVMNNDLIGVVNKWLGDAGYKTSNAAYYGRVYEAKKAGDEKKAQGMIDYLLKGKGVTNDTLNSGIKAAAKADENASATETAKFLLDEGESATDYIKKQYVKGNMTFDEAASLLKREDPKKSDDDIWWMLDRASYSAETGQTGVSGNYYRLKDAINHNSNDEIKAAVRQMEAHGYTAKQIKSWIGNKSTGFKEAYLNATGAEKVRIKDALIKAYKAVGVSETEAKKIINSWK